MMQVRREGARINRPPSNVALKKCGRKHMSFVDEWDQDRARNLVGCLVKETGFSASQIARRSGLAPSTLTRIYPNPTVGYSLSDRSVAKLKATFPDAFSTCETGALRLPSPVSEITAKDDPIFAGLPKKLIPVYAVSLHFPEEGDTAFGNELELWEGDLSRPAAYMAAPFGLGDAERYFAIYIPGEGMEPRFRAGERVILDRIKPASINADVVVQLREETGLSLWTVGRLSARDRSLIELMQYRDSVTSSIPHNKIKQIYPIIGMVDDDA
ncbi:hypothetical protein [Sphingobium bisphenolivorans]|uniref:hypothetical protein n=1 Tax=Sphingobium bisphenolivorans TaxID=1335760 RepID=UPI0003B783EA|nr:hypothetical protein [Sphingobium bisphenolivorans]